MAHTLTARGANATGVPCTTAAVVLLNLVLLLRNLLTLQHAVLTATAADLRSPSNSETATIPAKNALNMQRLR